MQNLDLAILHLQEEWGEWAEYHADLEMRAMELMMALQDYVENCDMCSGTGEIPESKGFYPKHLNHGPQECTYCQNGRKALASYAEMKRPLPNVRVLNE